MKILFVHPAAEISISDVARGYRFALERAGHEIRDYLMLSRMQYHTNALPPEIRSDRALLARQASENIVVEALYHEADLVLIVSGLNVHPVALWLLGKVGIRAAVILTESPYDDESQKQWSDLTHVGSTVDLTIFTNDQFSAERFGWHLLPPSFHPATHRPVEPVAEDVCDVLMVATGWRERQAFLEAVDWTGINLKLFGVWPGLNNNPDSPIYQYYNPLVVSNEHIASMYCSARICINFHRRSPVAKTPGPRIFETAACGAFQLSDPREGLEEMFGWSIPTFDSPERLGELVREYLKDPLARKTAANEAMMRVQSHTFDHRAADLIAAVQLPALQGV